MYGYVRLHPNMTILSFLLLLLPTFTPPPAKWVKQKIGQDVTILLPADFTPMTPEDLIQRYPSVRTPLGAFTDGNRLADFSVNVSATQWPDGNLVFAQSFFKSSVMNMFDRVEMIQEGIREQHKKKFIFFEFDSRLNPDRRNISTQDALVRYTYIMYLLEPSRTLVFSFTCTRDVKEDWQAAAGQIMKSVRVK